MFHYKILIPGANFNKISRIASKDRQMYKYMYQNIPDINDCDVFVKGNLSRGKYDYNVKLHF